MKITRYISALAMALCATGAQAQAISALPAASTLGGTEVTAVVQSTTTKKATIDQIKAWTSNAPTLVMPELGTPASGNFSTGSFTWPTFNQSTSGSAATLTTPRAIYGNNFNGSAALTQIIASTFGGTGNGFTKFSGPTTTERTFTLPDTSATLLYSGGALGTPSSGTLTNATGLPAAGVTGTAAILGANTFTALQTMNPGVNKRFWQLDPASTGDGVNFTATVNSTANTDATTNDVVFVGFNHGDAQQRLDTSKPSFGFSLENKWLTGGSFYSELHTALTTAAGTAYRPDTSIYPHDGTVGSNRAFNVDSFVVGKWSSSPAAVFTFDALNNRINTTTGMAMGIGGPASTGRSLIVTNALPVEISGNLLMGSGTYIAAGGDITQHSQTNAYIHQAAGGWQFINNTTITNVPLSIQGMASQSGHLTDWLNSSGTVLSAISAAGSHIAPAGTAGTPAFTFLGALTDGWSSRTAATAVRLSINGNAYFDFNTTGFGIRGSSINFTANVDPGTTLGDLAIARLAAANLRIGLAPSASPIANTLTIGEASRSGTDTNVGGANGTIASGNGTGTGTVSSLILSVPVAVVSGTGAQTMTPALTLNTALTLGANVVTPASSGTRFLCISTAGVVTSSASACSGT